MRLLTGRGSSFDLYYSRKLELLRALLAVTPEPMLMCGEVEPPSGCVEMAHEGPLYRYSILPSAEVGQLDRWLYGGGWQIFAARDLPAIQRTRPRDFGKLKKMVEIIREVRIMLCVSAFFDNDPWTIAINPEAFET